MSKKAILGLKVQIWHHSNVRENVIIGDSSIIGGSVYIGPDVKVGRNVKIQNNSLIYDPAVIEDGAFLGPSVILTNDQYPRSVNPDGSQKTSQDWSKVGVKVGAGASIGAGSICVAPVEIGAWALVAAGSTVISDVPAFSLVAGTPAKWIKWVGRAGVPLIDLGKGKFQCPKTGKNYFEPHPNTLVEENDV